MSDVKKILFVGKFNNAFRALSDFFDGLFNIQICVDNAAMVKGMLKLQCPELVVVSLCGIGENVGKIFEDIKTNYSTLPVVCIGTSEDVAACDDIMDTAQFTVLTMPIENEKILDVVCKVLNVTYENNMIIDNNKGGKKNILLVDDSNIQLRAMTELLKDKYDVRSATSGMQALTLIGKEKPDMIFLDYEMPVCDGRMTLEMIRELDEAKDLPVVFLTGVSDMKHIAAVLELKPAGYLLKPADSKQIYEIIEKILG